MKRVVTSYSLMPDTKVKIELLAYGMGKTISRLLDDMVDECWKKNSDKLRIDRLPKKYQSDLEKLITLFSSEQSPAPTAEKMLKRGLQLIPEKKHGKRQQPY
ncbi:MAG: hypothetical protein ABSA18_13625 [Dehalococcoidia bacterium]